MLNPENKLKLDLLESYEYWRHKSSIEGIAEPTVVAGVIQGILQKVNVLWPRQKEQAQVIKRVLKRKI